MAWKPVYASLAEMRDWLRMRNEADTDDDNLLRIKLSASSRALDKTCGRQFGKVETAVTRSYELRWSRTRCAYVADIDDLMDTTDLAVSIDGTAVDPAYYTLMPRNAIADGEPYTFIVITAGASAGAVLDMLALWGWNQTGHHVEPVKEATMLQTSRLNIRRDSPYGIAGGSDSGAELRLLERLDPDIAPIVADYVRTGWVAR